MAESKDSGLWYGCFGEATYDAESSQWTFARDLTAYKILRPVYRQYAKQDKDNPVTQISTEFKGTRHARQITVLSKAFPELQPAVSLLPDLLTVSEAVLSGSPFHDPINSARLAVAPYYDTERHQLGRLIAWCSGVSGCDVSIASLTMQRRGWTRPRAGWLTVPTIHNTIVIDGPGAPVRQICLNNTVAGVSPVPLLAIRWPDRTQLFRVDVTSDGLEVQLLFSLSAEDTSGAIHCHFTFNHFLGRQFAIVDASGGWKIWELEGRHYTNYQVVEEHYVDSADNSSALLDDGWSRVTWIGDTTAVAVATRSRIQLYTASDLDRQQSIIQVLRDPDTEWILDMQSTSDQPELLFVLTNVSVTILRFSTSVIGMQHEVLWQVQHHANPEDLTLRTNLVAVQDDTLLVIRSRTQGLSIFFQLSMLVDDKMHVAGPFEFRLPQATRSTQLLEVCLFPISLHTSRQHELQDAQYRAHSALDALLLQLVTLDDQYLVRTECYCLTAEQRTDTTLVQPSWVSKVKKKFAKLILSDDDYFLTENEEMSDVKTSNCMANLSRFAVARAQYTSARSQQGHKINLERSALEIDYCGNEAKQDITAVIKSAMALCDSNHPLRGAITQSLIEMQEGLLSINDLDDASALLEELSTSVPSKEAMSLDTTATVMHPIPLQRTLASLVLHGSPSTIYDAIVGSWITPLPPNIPGEIRLAKDNIAREIAAELTLSSHMLKVEQISAPGDTNRGFSQDDEFSQEYKGALQDSQDYIHSQSDTPRRGSRAVSATPSVMTSASRASSIYEAPQFSLSDYIVCTKPLPVSLPRPLQRVLKHWDVGDDPADYDWRARSQRVTRQAEEEERDSQLTESERRKLRRAHENSIKRHRKEAAASQLLQVASSQAPELMLTASQPLPERTSKGGAHDSYTPTTASQAVAGRHGGLRPAKKKRKVGF